MMTKTAIDPLLSSVQTDSYILRTLRTSSDVTSVTRTLLIGICSPCFQLGDLGGMPSTGDGQSAGAALSAPSDLGKCCPGKCTFWADDTSWNCRGKRLERLSLLRASLCRKGLRLLTSRDLHLLLLLLPWLGGGSASQQKRDSRGKSRGYLFIYIYIYIYIHLWA